MNNAVLHYIYDPLCGWCYGAAPLVRAAGYSGRPDAWRDYLASRGS